MDDPAAKESLEIALRWCSSQGAGWSISDQVGRGGTAPVYGVDSPTGIMALKLYDEAFSNGDKGEIEERRIEQQKTLDVTDTRA